jgi:hypothetical protein
VLIKLKVLWREGPHVDNMEEVCLSWGDRKWDVLCFVDQNGIWHRLAAIVVLCIVHGLIIIDQTRGLIMVEVAQGQSIFVVNAIRRIHICDDERASESINVLSTNVSMIPVSTRLVYYEFVDKHSTRLNRTLGYHRWSVCIGRVDLVKTMEMQGSALVRKIVSQSDNDCVAQIDRDRRAWPLPINANERSRISVGGGLYPANAPSEISSGRSWRSDIW